MTTTTVSPRISYRVGRPPELPRAVRRTGRLRLLAAVVVGVAIGFEGREAFWVLSATAVVWLATLLPLRVPRRVRDRARARRWVHSRSSALERALPGGLSPGEGG